MMIKLVLMYRKGIILLTAYCIVLSVLSADPPGWTEDRRLVFLPGGGLDPRADAWGDTVHLVWKQEYGHIEVYYKRSTDHGETWSDDMRLSVEDEIRSIMPDIAVKGDTVVVVWFEQQTGLLEYRRSIDGGMSWLQIDTLECPFSLTFPSVDFVKDTVYLTMGGYTGNYPVCFTKSTDGGATWDTVRQIYNDHFQQPRISVSWPDVHIVFTADDPDSGNTEVFYIGSHDGGRTWDEAMIISHRDGIAGQIPFNTSWPGGTAVSWYDYKYSPYPWTGDIFVRRRNKFGQWSEIDSITTAHRADWSDILAERTHLHVVWRDERHLPGYNTEIYYRESPDLGTTWYPEVRLTNAPYHSRTPSLACGGNYLHLFWADQRDNGNGGPSAIYYKRKDLSVTTPEDYQERPFGITISPNPSYGRVNIAFRLSEIPASVKIYDQLGRQLVNKEISRLGDHQIIWQTGRAGVYFIRLKTKTETITQKVVVLR
ncbi:hypothetical protein DRP53_10530 [candidate division WOR-3 bacterium]|uniref:Secretion system C-terminal sorting domain-containing protein n=1 Tax=candidate division WOR-3 bacterium TaxID=2052148 RepID=A0A660SCM0_UNCW3|nr:MAG: hypothetical protein DRP53_10530 [candidate division WOR-3 bacterium]